MRGAVQRGVLSSPTRQATFVAAENFHMGSLPLYPMHLDSAEHSYVTIVSCNVILYGEIATEVWGTHLHCQAPHPVHGCKAVVELR